MGILPDPQLVVVLRKLFRELEAQGFALKGETQEPGSEYPSLAQLDGPVQLDLLIAHTEFEESAVRGSHVWSGTRRSSTLRTGSSGLGALDASEATRKLSFLRGVAELLDRERLRASACRRAASHGSL